MEHSKNQEALLRELNQFTRRTHSLDEVYIFDLILCDNDIDRDGDCFSDTALDELRKRFVGVTGIFDHDPRSGNQTARIFHTELSADPERKTITGKDYVCLRANAYMIRTAQNADLIREIDGGIKKEVSISCAISQKRCSVCGANLLRDACGHIRGKDYGGVPCHTILDGVTDVFEWSFVAVPAQRGAGVTKKLGGLPCDPEKDALRRSVGRLTETVGSLTDALRRDVIRLCFRDGSNACAKALAHAAEHLDAEALLSLRKSLQDGLAAPDPAPQLPSAPAAPSADAGSPLSAYRFGRGEG